MEMNKSPRKDLHRVVEHLVVLARSFLEQRSARRASYFPSEGEGRKRVKSP
jgi:hypothetical protein